MALNKNVQDALNDQIKHEFYSAYVYLAVSAYCDRQGLPGFAHWMRAQSREEVEHATKLLDFISDRGGVVELQPLDKPPVDYGSPLQVGVTGLIDRLYETAVKERDYATQTMLQWFIDEQVEEEKNATLLVERVKMAGDNRSALLMLDMELGKRGE
jgi:ferritin